MLNIGDKAYYKGWFGRLIRVTIEDVKIIRNYEMFGVHTSYEYIIRFPSGRLKLIKDIKLF